MYDVISQQLIEPAQEKRYLGARTACRYCEVRDPSAFGRKTNAHTFPAALGNRILFSLDECKPCNDRFSVYEDALSKAVGPFLTLGGVKGRSGVRKTGLSNAKSTIRHTTNDGHRRLSITSAGIPDDLVRMDPKTGLLRLRMPIDGDKFVPRYAFKALLKMAVSLLPNEELERFQKATNCLRILDESPHIGPLKVGFSYSYVGNAPPTLAGTLLRRKDDCAEVPYLIFVFVAGSVCLQIWVRSDDMDEHVPNDIALRIEWTSQLPKPGGGYHPIRYSSPLQLDWTELSPRLQPFEAFDLVFSPLTNKGEFTPIPREPNN